MPRAGPQIPNLTYPGVADAERLDKVAILTGTLA